MALPGGSHNNVAEAEHLPPYMLAKTVIVRSPNGYAMAVLPADCRIDFDQLAATLNFVHLGLATEDEVCELFPESEVGAMPPFGALFDIPVYCDVRLAAEPYILFNAGTHRDAIHISAPDYLRVAGPAIIQFAYAEPRLPLTETMTQR